MENPASIYYYPDRMGRIIFLAMEEILGRSGVNAVLNLARLGEFVDRYPPGNSELSFQSLSNLQRALEDFYGPHGGRGVSLRIGRACFQHGLREFGPLFGLTDLAFRLLPMSTKFSVGSTALADIFNQYTDQHVRLEDKGKFLYWHIDRCPLCWEHQSEIASCQMAVGLLQEALFWLSGGKYFNVEEIRCKASGDSNCTIAIEKKPIG